MSLPPETIHLLLKKGGNTAPARIKEALISMNESARTLRI
jgi:hypothetical protein